MKRQVLMFGVIVVVLGGCKGKPAVSDEPGAKSQPVVSPVSTAPSPSTAVETSRGVAKGGPQFDWKQYDEETFETKPSQGRVFSVPENAGRLRVRLSASSSVDGAAMSRTKFKSGKGVVREENLYKEPCASIGVNQDDARCSLDPKQPAVYVVRDTRAQMSDPVAALLGKSSSAKTRALEANTTPNKIKVTLYVWACVANCGPLGGPAQ